MNSNIIRFACTIISILSWLQLSAAQDSKCFQRNPGISTDGCSIPIFKKFPYKELFETACNRHDICYSCGIQFMKDRLYCDELFLDDMRESCVERYKSRRLWRYTCRITARTVYFTAVRRFGGSKYQQTPKAECQQSWVHSCFP